MSSYPEGARLRRVAPSGFMHSMTTKSLKIFGKTVNLTLRNEGDYAIAKELFLDHQYRFCDDAIRKAKNPIIDIGGHLGFFSLYAGLMNPKVPIYTFEPHEGNFALLKMNLKNNGVRNVYPKQVAVSGKVGPIELYISKEDLNHSTVQALEPTGQTQTVQSTTLEKIFTKNNISRCDLIKIDCEGAEYELLYAAPPTVFEKTNHIFLEYHDWEKEGKVNGLKQFLQKQGYKVEQYPNIKFTKELGFLWCFK